MASKVKLSRHVYLRTQQRRLRHVRSILVRNLNVPTCERLEDPLSICVYFTLHSPKCPDEVIFTSQRVSGSYNPSWESLLFHSKHGSTLTFIARLWVNMNPSVEQFDVVYEKIINLADLIYIGTQLNKDISVNPAVGNSFIIGMHEGFYSDGAVTGAPIPPPIAHPLAQFLPAQSLMEVPKSEMLIAYENNIVLRLLNRQKALNMAKLKSNKARTEVNTFLSQRSAYFGSKVEKEGLKSRIAVLTQQLINQKGIEEEEQQTLSHLRRMQDVVEAKLRHKQDDLRRDREYFREQQLKHAKEVEKLQRVKLHKRMRQGTMILELCEAFRIKEEEDNFTICDIILPNADQLDTVVKADQVGVALGYTSHLVEQLAKVLLVPLPYPLKPNGSRSTIFDHISDKSLTENIQEFPLYVKASSDKWMCNYAVALLTRDIIQLRLHCGLRPTRQMYKRTLLSLKELMDGIIPAYQSAVSNAKQRPDTRQQRVALYSTDVLGEPAQSYTPDPPSQASDHPSQLSDPCSDVGFNIDELQDIAVVTESFQASVATGDINEDSGGLSLGASAMMASAEGRTAGVEGFQESQVVTPPLSSSSPRGTIPMTYANAGRASLLTTEGTRASPLATEGTRASPLTTEGTRVSPVTTDGTRSSPLTTEGTRSSPLTTEGTRASPLTTDGTRSSPLTTDGTRASPLTTDGTRSSPLTTEGTRASLLTTDGTRASPLTTEGTRASPVTTDGTHSSPLTTDGTRASPLTTEGTRASPLTTEEPRVGDVVHQSTPTSTSTTAAASLHKDALNRVFDEIYAKRKLNSLVQNKESSSNAVHTSSMSSTYICLIGPEGHHKGGSEVDNRRVLSKEKELCRLEDFVDSPPASNQGNTTYQRPCELKEHGDADRGGSL